MLAHFYFRWRLKPHKPISFVIYCCYENKYTNSVLLLIINIVKTSKAIQLDFYQHNNIILLSIKNTLLEGWKVIFK